MNRVRARRRQDGALLLLVALLLAMMAALAFGVGRNAGMDVLAVSSDYDRRNAAYLAQAAVAAAKWTNEVAKCTSTSLAAMTLAGGTISATVAKAPSKKINVVATATTATGAMATLTRTELPVYDLTSSESKDLGGTPRDTYIDSTVLVAPLLGNTLNLTSNQGNALLYWAMTDIPAGSEVISAKLILTVPSSASSSVARTVNVHRLMTQWDGSATWYQAQLLVGWTGGNYSAPVVSTLKVTGAGTYTWDVTGLADGWVGGRLADYGMLMRLQDPGQTVSFYSLEASGSLRPILRVVFSKQC